MDTLDIARLYAAHIDKRQTTKQYKEAGICAQHEQDKTLNST